MKTKNRASNWMVYRKLKDKVEYEPLSMGEYEKRYEAQQRRADKRYCGRTASYPTAPAQIPACGTTAPGFSEILTSAEE